MANFKHTGDVGDILYSAVVMRALGGGTLYLNPVQLGTKTDNTPSGLDAAKIAALRPLLLEQEYIDAVEVFNGQPIDYDLDQFRHVGVNLGENNLCRVMCETFNVPFESARQPWLAATPHRIASVVFNRTERYKNPSIDYRPILERFQDRVFVGLPHEHELFCREWGEIDYCPTADFLELAGVIAGSDLFVGNQSSPMAVAIGLGVEFIQEVCRYSPNCKFPWFGRYLE